MQTRRARIAAPLLVAALAGAVAVPAHARDLSGTITVREVSTEAIGGTKDVTTVWTLDGRLRGGGGAAVARATPVVRAYADRTAYTTDFGDAVCSFTTFDGWVPGAQNPVRQELSLDLRAVNLLTRRSTGILTFLGTGPLAAMSAGNCGFAPEPIGPGSLMGSGNQGSGGAYSRALMGVGNLETRTRRSTRVLGPQDHLAPGSITFRRAGGRWRADGVRTRSGSFRAGIRGSGTRTVRVEWHLRSRVLSARCVVPPRSRVRGRTVPQVMRLLRRAGLRPGPRLADSSSPVPRGRVTGLSTLGFTEPRCGSRVAVVVSG